MYDTFGVDFFMSQTIINIEPFRLRSTQEKQYNPEKSVKILRSKLIYRKLNINLFLWVTGKRNDRFCKIIVFLPEPQ